MTLFLQNQLLKQLPKQTKERTVGPSVLLSMLLFLDTGTLLFTTTQIIYEN